MDETIEMGRAVVFLFSLALASCTTVTCTVPVGETPTLLSPADFEGTWLADEVAFSLEVAHTNGLLRLSWIEATPDRATGPKPSPAKKQTPDAMGRIPRPSPLFKSALIEVRTFRDWTFTSLQDPDHPNRRNWYWARLEASPDELRFHLPEAKAFSNLVATGVLPGRTEGSSVVLGKLDAMALGRLRNTTNLPLWETNVLRWRRHGRK